jgi:signal peptidase I
MMASRAQRAVHAAVHGLWVGVIPALLAGLVLKFLVPQQGSELPEIVATVGRRYPVPLGVACFLLFSAIARYWRLLLPEDGALNAARPTPRSRQPRQVLGTLAAVAIAAATALLVRAKFVDSYRVLSASMLPTLEPDDRIAARRVSYGAPSAAAPRRGDVIVFRSNAVSALAPVAIEKGAPLPEVLLKRVVGLPGDRITMHVGAPVINGWEVPTCNAGEYIYVLPYGDGSALRGQIFVEFLEDRAYLTVHAVASPRFEGPYIVAPGEVFVLGDNRANSVDSRVYNRGQGGGVPLSAVDAQATWFLAGTHRSGDTDLTRLFKRVDGLEHRLRIEGVNGHELEEGIAGCLGNRPPQTYPPPPNVAGVTVSSAPGPS